MSDHHPLVSRLIKLLEDDIDTDQMVPARFLRTSASTGLSKVLFYDRIHHTRHRTPADPTKKDSSATNIFPLDPTCYAGESILLTGHNFGCGSSREHAAWALREFGIQVILAPSFGDIFKNNALKNGLIAIEIDHDFHLQLQKTLEAVTFDLAKQEIRNETTTFSFSIDPFARYCLLRGISQFDYLLENLPLAARFHSRHGDRFSPVTQDL